MAKIMWKDQLIENREGGETFLAAQISTFSKHKINTLSWNGLVLYELRIDEAAPYNSTYMLRLKLHRSNNKLSCLNISVNRTMQGKGIGLMAVKAMIGHAHEYACENILINNPTDIGYGFWASVGATPLAAPYRLGAHIRLALQNNGLKMGRECVDQWKKISALSDKNPLEGWREIAAFRWDKIKGEKHGDHPCAPARLTVLKQAAQGANLSIDLTSPATRRVLESRLGRLPSFSSTQIRAFG